MPAFAVLLAAYLVFPLTAASVYASVWPTVYRRRVLFISIGSILGIGIAAATIIWASIPLTGVGIAGAQPGEPTDTVWSILGTRMVIAAITEISAVCVVLILLARWVRSR